MVSLRAGYGRPLLLVGSMNHLMSLSGYKYYHIQKQFRKAEKLKVMVSISSCMLWSKSRERVNLYAVLVPFEKSIEQILVQNVVKYFVVLLAVISMYH